MAQEQQDPLCVFTQRADGIYEAVFKKASRFAIDSFWEQLENILETTVPDDAISCLMDWRRAKMPPFRYMSQRAKQVLQLYPDGPKTRLAILHNPGTLLNMAQTMAQFTRSKTSERRYFPEDQYDEAIAWLLEN